MNKDKQTAPLMNKTPTAAELLEDRQVEQVLASKAAQAPEVPSQAPTVTLDFSDDDSFISPK